MLAHGHIRHSDTQPNLEAFQKDIVLLHSPPHPAPTCWDYNYVQTQLEATFLTESASNIKGTKDTASSAFQNKPHTTPTLTRNQNKQKTSTPFLELGEYG